MNTNIVTPDGIPQQATRERKRSVFSSLIAPNKIAALALPADKFMELMSLNLTTFQGKIFILFVQRRSCLFNWTL